ncbi:hypothetical protein LJR235_002295 [Pararhizobium sp. LjRoot235]|uniref:hypothetical protein n=1 Tax=Pararhizobium sp. LjRoot235 TaxID=3342291 RepID=UPI003ECD8E2C
MAHLDNLVTLLGEISKSGPQESSGLFPGLSNRPTEYLHLENTALADALELAGEHPGNELKIWRKLAEIMEGFNAKLREIGAQELKVVPFDVFLIMTELDAEAASV